MLAAFPSGSPAVDAAVRTLRRRAPGSGRTELDDGTEGESEERVAEARGSRKGNQAVGALAREYLEVDGTRALAKTKDRRAHQRWL